MAVKAWYQYADLNNFMTNWNGSPINGDDIPMPQGTSISAIVSGTISKMYQDNSGGLVIIHADDPSQTNGIPYYYFAHLDTFSPNLTTGSHVNVGDQIGTSGGQNSGGTMNASPQWSTGPHIMLGLSHTSSVPVGSSITSDLNPRFLLSYAQGQKIPVNSPQQTCTCPSGYTHQTNPNGVPPASTVGFCKNTSFPYDSLPCKETGETPLQQAQDAVTTIQNLANAINSLPQNLPKWGEAIAIFLMALLLIIGGVILLAGPSNIENAVRKVAKAA